MEMPFDNILCSTLNLWPSHGRHTRLIESTMVLCVNLRAKEVLSFFKKFLKAIGVCCPLSTGERCVYRIFFYMCEENFGQDGFEQDAEKL